MLHQNLEELRADAAQEERDLAQAVLGLNAKLESMGDAYQTLMKPGPEALALIERAKQELTNAENSVPDRVRREAEISEMFNWWGLSKRRQRAREQLDRDIAKAEARIERAKVGITEAEAQAKEMDRERLMNADMEESLQEFKLRVEETIRIMEARRGVVVDQIAKVTAQKANSFKVKEQAAAKVEEYDEELETLEAQLRAEEEALASMVNGTEEHSKQSTKVSELGRKVEDTRGKRNTAHVIFQSKERFAEELSIHERTQMKLRDNLGMWISMLKSDTEARVTTFRSRLEAMKAMSDQDVAKDLDKLGVEIDINNAEFMATAGNVSDKIRMKRMEEHPEIFAAIVKANAAAAEAHQLIREREAEALRVFREQYGIDPLASSFFSFEGNAGDPQGGNDDQPSGQPTGAGEPSGNADDPANGLLG